MFESGGRCKHASLCACLSLLIKRPCNCRFKTNASLDQLSP